ncbi:hypothetical protein BDY17DRAFT_348950 [Neohortaea acidophila]|uniref:Uncharacterized protein n=1 Tax=Neohortaea acidophila TaxID=245834 RepID=A0A6A6PHB3_9PEZI|nr:uncharacterized protein BDY17DRAFT_348950 [Neohortaea acidophila]KAF2479389.1 hypothetical protein BDY17DRAFT_348950 [Neohortaea acidophila]
MFKRPNPLRRAPHSSSRAGPSARQQSSNADRPRPPSQGSLDGAVSFFGRFSMDRPPSRRQDSVSSSTVSPTEQQAMEVNEHETASSYFAQTFVTAQEDGSRVCTSPLETPAMSPPSSPTAPPGPLETRTHLTPAQVQELRKLRRDLCEAFVIRYKMVANRDPRIQHARRKRLGDQLGFTANQWLATQYNACHLVSLERLAADDAQEILRMAMFDARVDVFVQVQRGWVPEMFAARSGTGRYGGHVQFVVPR